MRRSLLRFGGDRGYGLGRPLDDPLADSAALFDLPADEVALLRHYTLLDDIKHIRARGHDRLAFARQLCDFRVTIWMGPHLAHRRTPMGKAQIAGLATLA